MKPRLAVVVVRELDAPNRIRTFGDVAVLDVDWGQADLRQPDEAAEWVRFHQGEMRRIETEIPKEALWAYRAEVWTAMEHFD